MKTSIPVICLLLFLSSCSNSFDGLEETPIVMTVEVTRIIQVTSTPIPTKTMTSAPTMQQGEIGVTEKIGTPIVADDECYKTAQSQFDLNVCAGSRLQELKERMTELVNIMESHYQPDSQKLEKFQILQTGWEDFSKSECEFRANLDSDLPGSMAPMIYAECMVGKYEDRLREYQSEIFRWAH